VDRLSDVGLLSNLDGIIHFYAEVAHGALDLGVPKQELHRAQVSSPAINQHRLRAPQRVGTELGRIESDAGDPLMDKARVLPSREPVFSIASTGKKVLTCLSSRQPIRCSSTAERV